MKKIDISIIVPAFNAEKTIEKCLDSLISQTKKELEFIIVNDGSVDNTEKIIKKYTDKRIKYFKNENQGIGKTRNFGIEKATGEYIMFLDSDDYLANDACNKFYEKAHKEKLDMVVCDFYRVTDEKLVLEDLMAFENTTLEKMPILLEKINLSPWNKLYKTSLIKDNSIKFIEDLKYEDAPFVVECLFKAKKIGKINEPLNYYVIHKNSETTIRDERIFDILKIIDIIRNKLKNVEYLKESLDKLTVRIITNYTIQQRVQEDVKVADNFIDEAFSYLKKEVPDYKDNKYYETRSFPQRTIEKNKCLSKLYCKLYRMKKNTIKMNLINIFLIIFFFLFSCIILNNFLNINKDRTIIIKPYIMILYLAIYFLINYLLFKFIKSKVKKHSRLHFFMFVLFLGLQLAFAYIFACDGLTWDFGTAYTMAFSDASKKTAINYFEYLYVHPTNIGICILLKIWYRLFFIFKIISPIKLGIILNIIFINIAIFYTYRIMKEYFSKEKCTLFLLIVVLFTPLITYVPVFYTDTLSLPFGIAGIYYYLCRNKSKKNLLLSGLLLGIGSCIKFTVSIALIAIVISHFLENKNLIKIMKMTLVILLGFLIPYLSYKFYIYKAFDSKKLDEVSVPITHYIMMGLKGSGHYDYHEQDFTGGIIGVENKKKANIKVIKKRLNTMIKKHTLLKHFLDKTAYVWGDGTMYASTIVGKGTLQKRKIQDYIFEENKNGIFNVISQCEWYFILLFIVIGIAFRNYLNEKQRKLQFLLSVTTFGVYLFFLIWEASSRYLINFIPVFLLLGFLGITALSNYWEFKKNYK